MSGHHGKFIVIVLTLCLALSSLGCGSFENFGVAGRETASDAEEIEIQVVPTITSTRMPAPAEPPKATLQTEIIAPISPISPVSPMIPTEQPTVSPINRTIQPIAGSEAVLALALEDLSEQSGSPPDEIILVSMEAIQWRDSSLGCPQEGFFYAQVITPGYKIVFEVQGQQYEYHTDQARNVVLCQE